MAIVYVSRTERFNAAHKLEIKDWSLEKNLATFGKCANPNWHGHNYKLIVTVKGEPDPLTGFVMDAKELGQIMRTYVTDKVDHKNMNIDVDFMKGIQPTTENIVVAFWNQIAPHIKGCTLHSIRLHETEKIYTEYFGE